MRGIAKTLLVAATLCLAAALFAPKPSGAAEKMTLMLDWFINPDHAPLFVALEKGYFADAGIEVELIAPADPNDPPKLVAARKADLAVSYQPQLHLQVAEGLPLVRIATLVATPLNTLLVLADGPVQSIADLKGRTVGYSVGGFEDALLGAMLERHGLRVEDVTLVNVNFSLSPSLLSGQVDAVIGAYRNFELNQMDIEGHAGRAFYIEEEGVPPMTSSSSSPTPTGRATRPCGASSMPWSAASSSSSITRTSRGSSSCRAGRSLTTSSTSAPGATPCPASR